MTTGEGNQVAWYWNALAGALASYVGLLAFLAAFYLNWGGGAELVVAAALIGLPAVALSGALGGLMGNLAFAGRSVGHYSHRAFLASKARPHRKNRRHPDGPSAPRVPACPTS